MIVKNVSYFSLLIAITAIASMCGKASAQQTNDTPEKVIVAAAEALPVECSVKLLAKILAEKGMDLSQFKITTRTSGNELKIYLVANKTYKGGLLSKIFHNNQYEFGNTSVAAPDNHLLTPQPDFAADQRLIIESKNQVLRI